MLAYEQQMRAARVGSKAFEEKDSVLLSTKADNSSSVSSKHNWIICDNTKDLYEFSLSLENPIPLNHLAISLTFTQKKLLADQEKQVGPAQIEKEEHKEGVIKTVETKGLGLLTVSGGGDSAVEEKKYHVPLIIYSHKGAQYNFQNCATRILADNSLVFASNYAKPEFIMAHQFGKRIQVDKVYISTYYIL